MCHRQEELENKAFPTERRMSKGSEFYRGWGGVVVQMVGEKEVVVSPEEKPQSSSSILIHNNSLQKGCLTFMAPEGQR